MISQRIRNPVMAGGFAGPATLVSIGFESVNVAELRLASTTEFGAGYEVVASFADVAVRTGAGGFVKGTIAVRNTGFEHLTAEPTHGVGDDRFADRSNCELSPK